MITTEQALRDRIIELEEVVLFTINHKDSIDLRVAFQKMLKVMDRNTYHNEVS